MARPLNFSKAPFPYFGGKSAAAPAIWTALGDVQHYVEPFCGSLAVLLNRPHVPNRTYHSETVNDFDGLLVNAWRSIQLSPDATADAASNPVAEADLMARHLAILKWKRERELERLMADPLFHDPVIAGWWLWGLSSWIGSGWCAGSGPWVVGEDGRVEKQARAGSVNRKLPNLGNDGRGVNHPGLREEGVSRQLPHLSDNGKSVNRPQLREEGTGEPEYHPVTMPELLRWFRYLSARLRHVRIVNGDWARLCTGSAVDILSVRGGKGFAGVFLDPPYGDVRAANVYANDSLTISADVRAWCLEHGDKPHRRIVLAGFDTEHVELEDHGWRVVEWFKGGWLKGGWGNTGAAGSQMKRDRLWLSPHCLTPESGGTLL